MPSITRKIERFTVAEYLKMDRAGMFDEQPVELIRGRIVQVHAQANPHRWSVSKSSRKLFELFPAPSHWVVVQGTLVLEPYGAPEPDLHVFDVPEGTPDVRLPKPILVIEVSDSTYRTGSGIKLEQYAAVGIAEYWIVNLNAHRLEVHRGPGRGVGTTRGWAYADIVHHSHGGRFRLHARPDLEVSASDFLP